MAKPDLPPYHGANGRHLKRGPTGKIVLKPASRPLPRSNCGGEREGAGRSPSDFDDRARAMVRFLAARGLSQRVIAKAAGVSQPTVVAHCPMELQAPLEINEALVAECMAELFQRGMDPNYHPAASTKALMYLIDKLAGEGQLPPPVKPEDAPVENGDDQVAQVTDMVELETFLARLVETADPSEVPAIESALQRLAEAE